jgi:hypothetical protein
MAREITIHRMAFFFPHFSLGRTTALFLLPPLHFGTICEDREQVDENQQQAEDQSRGAVPKEQLCSMVGVIFLT